jgi:hypothetical protein
MENSTIEKDVSNSNSNLDGSTVPIPYIQFRCKFKEKLGCRIQGDGPILVTQIIDLDAVNEYPGTLLKREGDVTITEKILSRGLHPTIGDVVVAVNNNSVSHLNAEQLQFFISRLKSKGEIKQTRGRNDSFSSMFERDFENMSITASMSGRGRRNSTTNSQYALSVVFRRYFVDEVEDIVKTDAYYKEMTDNLVQLRVSIFKGIILFYFIDIYL